MLINNEKILSYHSKMNYSYKVVNFSTGIGMKCGTGAKWPIGIKRCRNGMGACYLNLDIQNTLNTLKRHLPTLILCHCSYLTKGGGKQQKHRKSECIPPFVTHKTLSPTGA